MTELPSFLTLENIFWIIKIFIVGFNLIFGILVLRHLIDLQDNYRAKAYLIFLAVVLFLLFNSIVSFFAVIFY
jgi:hypothetical protein